MTALFEKLLPVLIMVLIGLVMRKKSLVTASAINELKQIIVNVALPCILFLSFGNTILDSRYIVVVIMVFVLCGALYLMGFVLKYRIPRFFDSIFTPWFMAGFEFGMIGIGLFGALWGTGSLPIFMLIALGHEFFAWFICIPYVQFKSSGIFSIKGTVIRFLKTPVILGILGGLAANVTDVFSVMDEFFWGRSLLSAMNSLSNITVPLILIVVGYSLVFERSSALKAALYMAARLVGVLVFGTIALSAIHRFAGQIDPLFTAAFYAYLLLPPSYLVPVMVKDNEEERYFFSQTVIYYTVISFAGYVLLMLF
ncbi:MAG: hypothetical protein K0R19_2465 [Bacillota bacterium]|jgi:predicted permease|nr:hypothetical protein [Bacillota bacterium]